MGGKEALLGTPIELTTFNPANLFPTVRKLTFLGHMRNQ
jgi:hypothetical protein